MLDHTSQIVLNLSSKNPHFQNEATCITSHKQGRIQDFF